MALTIDQRKAELQRFFRVNLNQLLSIKDPDEQANYLVGAVETFFTKIAPNLKDVEEVEEVKEPPVVNVTPDPSNEFGEIKIG